MSEQPFLSRRAVLATLASAAAPGIALAAPIDAQRVRAQLAEKWTDVDSALVLSGGVPTFEFYRDGQPDRARPQFSVGKSVLSALVGRALADGHLRSIDERVLDIVPEWAKENADERLRSMTIGHLLTMTAGFAVNDPTGTARADPIPGPWRRPMAAAPGERFAYDNGAFALLAAALERAVKMPLADYARAALAQPLGLAEPDLRSGLAMRTRDMARIGQLYLQEGEWEGRQLLAPGIRRRVHPGAERGWPAGDAGLWLHVVDIARPARAPAVHGQRLGRSDDPRRPGPAAGDRHHVSGIVWQPAAASLAGADGRAALMCGAACALSCQAIKASALRLGSIDRARRCCHEHDR